MIRIWLATGVVVACLALRAEAQGLLEKPQRQVLERRLAEQRNALLRKGAEVSRLMDLLIRNGFGLPIPATEFALTDAERTARRADVETELRASLERVTELAAELDQKRARLEALRRAGPTATDSRPSAPPEGVAETPFGDAPIPAAPPGTMARPAASARPPAEQPDPPAHAEPKPAPRPPSRDGTLPLLVHGTLDHGRIGRAAYHAGEFELARGELEIATRGQDASLLDLFLLAKTYEKLSDHARADSMLLRIEEADTASRPDGTRVPGSWAIAAQTARQHLHWMRDHRSWTPRFPWKQQNQQQTP